MEKCLIGAISQKEVPSYQNYIVMIKREIEA